MTTITLSRFLIAAFALTIACTGSSHPTAPSAATDYDRATWDHWIDSDGDCQDTRAEVLIEESLTPVAFADARRCRVVAGRWRDLYTGLIYTDASDLDIDHLVPLAEAHRSGGASWDSTRKRAFANDLSDAWHLIAVGSSVNRQKGAQTPATWRPPDRASWCDYARAWRRIKARWQLRMAGEEAVLLEMERTC